MPSVFYALSIPANGEAKADLRPYDRLGGGGGAVKLRSTTPLGTAGNSIQQTMFIGSELAVGAAPVGAERAVGAGPDNFTPQVGGIGGPGDPVTVSYRNLTVGAIVVTGVVDILNA
jgi:hypothetical protein